MAPADDSRFIRCVNFILGPAIEGGWSDRPADRGGPTNHGITERTFSEAITRGIIPADTSHRSLTVAGARLILRELYWTPARCDEFPPPLDLLLMDATVNHRPSKAAELLQRALRMDYDGIIGPVTIATAQHAKRPSLVVARYIVEREDFYERIVEKDSSQAAFISGWRNRLVVLHREAMRDLAA